VQATIFWLVGVAFFAVQAATLLYLLRTRRVPSGREDEGRRVEIVWTLVPAAMLAALVLMVSGLTRGTWTRVRDGSAPLAAARPASEPNLLIAVPAPSVEHR
jgi:heme/copper-type cytochrome/quinol oxidase subunit 2